MDFVIAGWILLCEKQISRLQIPVHDTVPTSALQYLLAFNCEPSSSDIIRTCDQVVYCMSYISEYLVQEAFVVKKLPTLIVASYQAIQAAQLTLFHEDATVPQERTVEVVAD
jgi:hypothetical protein